MRRGVRFFTVLVNWEGGISEGGNGEVETVKKITKKK